eukprot:10782593-Ditylum_brightwellii.AAC.1
MQQTTLQEITFMVRKQNDFGEQIESHSASLMYTVQRSTTLNTLSPSSLLASLSLSSGGSIFPHQRNASCLECTIPPQCSASCPKFVALPSPPLSLQ